MSRVSRGFDPGAFSASSGDPKPGRFGARGPAATATAGGIALPAELPWPETTAQRPPGEKSGGQPHDGESDRLLPIHTCRLTESGAPANLPDLVLSGSGAKVSNHYWGRIPGQLPWQSGRGLPHSPTLSRLLKRLVGSARFWTAEVLCRFHRRTRGPSEYPNSERTSIAVLCVACVPTRQLALAPIRPHSPSLNLTVFRRWRG